MNKESGIVCLYKGLMKDDPNSVMLIEKVEASKSVAFFEDPAVKELIYSAGHIIRLQYQHNFKLNVL